MTFQFCQITAASPFALATTFAPPMLPRPHDSAVVTIRKALNQLPAEVRDSTLEELTPLTVTSAVGWASRTFKGWRVTVEGVDASEVGDISVPGYRLADVSPDADLAGRAVFLLVADHYCEDASASPEAGLLAALRAELGAKGPPLPNVLVGRHHCLRDLINRAGFSDAEVNVLTGRLTALERRIFETPASSRTDVQAKVWLARALTQEEGGTLAENEVDGLLSDVERLFVSKSADDRVALDAFDVYRSSRIAHLDLPDDASDADANALLKPGDLAFDRLLRAKPGGLDAILGKLRAGFTGLVDEAWMDHALRDPEHSEFRAGLDLSDCYVQMLYSGIEDLARVAGDTKALAPATSNDFEERFRRRNAWDRALNAYTKLRAISDATHDDDPAVEDTCNAYCDAMEVLIATPAPDAQALLTKISFAVMRAWGFGEGVFKEHLDPIIADIERLAPGEGIDLRALKVVLDPVHVH